MLHSRAPLRCGRRGSLSAAAGVLDLRRLRRRAAAAGARGAGGVVDASVRVPELTPAQAADVLRTTGAFKDAHSASRAVDALARTSVPIKPLLSTARLARATSSNVDALGVDDDVWRRCAERSELIRA